MKKIYKNYLINSIIIFLHLSIYYFFGFLFPIFVGKYHIYLIKNFPMVFVELILYGWLTVILISYVSVKKISNDIKNMQDNFINSISIGSNIKVITILNSVRVKSNLGIFLAIIFYPFYLSIVYYNFIYVILDLKNEKLLKKRIIAPALISYVTAGFSSIFILIMFIFILLFKIENEKKKILEPESKKVGN